MHASQDTKSTETNQISSVAAFWGYHRALLFCYLRRFRASDISYSLDNRLYELNI